MVFKLDWSQSKGGNEAMRKEWAWQKLYYLIGEHIKTGSPDILNEIFEIEARYDLRVPYRIGVTRL